MKALQNPFLPALQCKNRRNSGEPDADIRLFNRWNSQALEGVYLNPIPYNAVRAIA
jgi:hypothetical protein